MAWPWLSVGFMPIPPIRYPADLPITARRDEIVAAIRDHQVLILAGETGSCKVTVAAAEDALIETDCGDYLLALKDNNPTLAAATRERFR